MFKSRGHSKYTTTCLSHLACSSAKGGLTLYHPIAPLGGPSIFGDTRNWELSSFTLEAIEIGLAKNWSIFLLEFGVNCGYISVWILGQFSVHFSAVHGTHPSKKTFFEKGPAFHHEEPVRSLYAFAIGNRWIGILWGIFISEHPWISLVKNILRRPRGFLRFSWGILTFHPFPLSSTWRILC